MLVGLAQMGEYRYADHQIEGGIGKRSRRHQIDVVKAAERDVRCTPGHVVGIDVDAGDGLHWIRLEMAKYARTPAAPVEDGREIGVATPELLLQDRFELLVGRQTFEPKRALVAATVDSRTAKRLGERKAVRRGRVVVGMQVVERLARLQVEIVEPVFVAVRFENAGAAQEAREPGIVSEPEQVADIGALDRISRAVERRPLIENDAGPER